MAFFVVDNFHVKLKPPNEQQERSFGMPDRWLLSETPLVGNESGLNLSIAGQNVVVFDMVVLYVFLCAFAGLEGVSHE